MSYASIVRSSMRPWVAASLSLALLTVGAAAQSAPQRIIRLQGGVPIEVADVIVAPGAPGAPVLPPGAAAPGDDQAAKVDPQLMQRFQKLAFDRRTSAILAAWSKPEPLPADEDPELTLPEPPPAPPTPEPATGAPAEGDPATGPPATGQDAPGGEGEDGGDGSDAPVAAAPAQPETAPPSASAPAPVTTGAATSTNALVVAAQHEPPPTPAPDATAGTAPPVEAPDPAVAAAQTEHQKAMAEYEKKKKEIEGKRLDRFFERMQRCVTLGRWDQLPAFFERFGAEAAAETIYPQLLAKLATAPPPEQRNNQLKPFWEANRFNLEDVAALVQLAPGEDGFKPEQAATIPPLLALAFSQGHTQPEWVDVLRTECARPEAERKIDQRLAARLLTAQSRDLDLADFVPTLADAVANDDREGLNLLAKHLVAKYDEEEKPAFLERAWEATLAALAAGEIDEDQKATALRRAASLASKVRDELGDSWLEESFTERPERGMEVLATIGGQAAASMTTHASKPDYRKEGLQLLHNAIQALLTAAPERGVEWRDALSVAADAWLREARHSYKYSQASSMGPITRRDPFGNIYWVDYRSGRVNTPVQPIEPGDLLELRPDGTWRELLADGVRPTFDTVIARLYLKVNEEKLAFPYIERLAGTHADTANELAKEFLRVWIKNNDPNSERSRTNVYMFSYGFNQRASGIPLTRSKQERNLRDLEQWVNKLRAIDGIELDTELLVQAFVKSHSAAEVFRIGALEKVFGTLEDLDDKTLASMAQTMRANLATTWRRPDVQQQAKTRRRQKDIEREVQTGYGMAQAMLARAIEAHPDSWRLMCARAAMTHDLNNYRNAIKKSADFTNLRRDALGQFQAATRAYMASVPELDKDDETIEAFEFWYHAALGASDVGAIDQSTTLARQEIPQIRDALAELGGASAKRHVAKFANSLFTKLSSVNPAVKNRFLESGFEIVGKDHPQAREAAKVYDYYRDLVHEIKLVAEVDGSGDVGTEPFGVRIDLRYTKEIERESGGFAKYLQNQANNVNIYFNYGRPPENYRDKFEESIQAALQESFEVKSLTFNAEDVASKATTPFNWRRMPYAYLLLQAKGPQVDRIPELKMDLDFLDVTGYAVLPITSAVVPIDAAAAAEPRPFERLEVTQILDERKADEGVLGLEIKATALGLLPELDQILDLAPADFEVESVDDGGVTISRFGDDEESIQSERLWQVTLRGKEGEQPAKTFAFAAQKDDAAQVIYQRYDDADLVTAKATVELLGSYGKPSGWPWWLWLVMGTAAVLLVLVLWLALRDPPRQAAATGLQMPERVTPFSVLALLREVRAAPRLDDVGRREIDATIARIEHYYFGPAEGDAPNLGAIAGEWVRRA
ncbi:MAG: hypothetical protein AAF628_21790 [Planctomycetota bacterium]